MMDWFWYMVGGIVGSSATFVMLLIFKKLNRIEFRFKEK